MPYVIRPRADTWETLSETPHLEGRTIFEREPANTGLVSKDGHPIYRTPEPIGFVALQERN